MEIRSPRPEKDYVTVLNMIVKTLHEILSHAGFIYCSSVWDQSALEASVGALNHRTIISPLGCFFYISYARPGWSSQTLHCLSGSNLSPTPLCISPVRRPDKKAQGGEGACSRLKMWCKVHVDPPSSAIQMHKGGWKGRTSVHYQGRGDTNMSH